ncbi:MAG: hypothetical protein HQK98_12100 [Nitrospirae bacterium]|nr:hypothetical protein [Nitrospirota bacterium]
MIKDISGSGDLPLWKDNPEALNILNELSNKYAVSIDLLRELIKVEQKYVGKERRRNIDDYYDSSLDTLELEG